MLTLEQIYASEFRFVWRNLCRLGVPSSDVADATQEVFLVVHRKLHEFDGCCKVSTWLYRICFNVASDRRRRAHVRREVPHDEATLEQTAAFAPPAREDLRVFDQILDTMELEQRAAFVLFEVEGYTGPEIAEMLACPLPTVYSRLRLARETFAREAHRYRATYAREVRGAAL